MITGLRKLFGDVSAMPWRFAMMIIAIALSSAAIIAMLLAYNVLTREMSHNYLSTNPAAAQLMVGQADVMTHLAEILPLIQKTPHVIQAEAGGHIYFQVEVAPNRFVNALIFVVPDLQHMTINKIRLDTGQWPAKNAIVLERKALSVAKAKVGDEIKLVRSASGAIHSLQISGLVHDPALAPADTEDMIYGYMSQATFLQLHETLDENFIKFTVSQEFLKKQAIETIASNIIKNIMPVLQVHEVRIPPPARHPHQTQMTSGLRMLLLFSVLAVLLGAVLIATTLWGILAQQVRQIGIMKTLGASTTQISSLYLLLVGCLGAVALMLGLPIGVMVGRNLITMAADVLNLEITDFTMPIIAWGLSIIFCIGLPIAMALFPITRAANKTVRAALDEYGVSANFFIKNESRISFKYLPPAWILVLRNLIRRRGRFVFTLLLLTMAGAVFLSSKNLLASWDALAQRAEKHRHYQIDIGFSQFVDEARVSAILHNRKDIKVMEVWNKFSTTPSSQNGIAIEQTYPDGGHGSLTLRSAPENTQLISLDLIAGHWLSSHSNDEVVLNQSAYEAFFSDKNIGDTIELRYQENNHRFLLAGILREPLTSANAYTNINQSSLINGIRIELKDISPDNIDKFSTEIQHLLLTEGINVNSMVTENHRLKSGNGHLTIMILILIMIAAVMTLVGFFGLATVTSTNVSERLREFAIMRTLGAKNNTIAFLVISESLLTALCSYLLAFPLAILFSQFIVSTIAAIAIQPLTLLISAEGLLAWLGILFAGTVLISIIPAINAMRFTIREVLTYL